MTKEVMKCDNETINQNVFNVGENNFSFPVYKTNNVKKCIDELRDFAKAFQTEIDTIDLPNKEVEDLLKQLIERKSTMTKIRSKYYDTSLNGIVQWLQTRIRSSTLAQQNKELQYSKLHYTPNKEELPSNAEEKELLKKQISKYSRYYSSDFYDELVYDLEKAEKGDPNVYFSTKYIFRIEKKQQEIRDILFKDQELLEPIRRNLIYAVSNYQKALDYEVDRVTRRLK